MTTVAQRKIPSHAIDRGPRLFSLRPVLDLILSTWAGDNGAEGGRPPRANLVAHAALVLGVDRQYVYRWLHDGLGVYQADVVAVILGRHPVDIWPDWYELSVPSDEEVAASEDLRAAKRRAARRAAQKGLREKRAAFRADPHAWERNRPRRARDDDPLVLDSSSERLAYLMERLKSSPMMP